MSNLYLSNQLEMLAGKLAENIDDQSGSIFNKTMIITQGAGMNAWLTAKLTEVNKVFAHYEFLNQDSFLSRLHELLFGKKPANITNATLLAIYELLGSKDFKREFDDVASYFEDDDLRRMQLARRINDLFDQYQVYRNDIMIKWENDQLATDNPAENWQKWLWKKLNVETKFTTRNEILKRLNEDNTLLTETWPEIHLFGISIYTEFHLDFYKRLGDHVKVNFYVNLPGDYENPHNQLIKGLGSKVGELHKSFEDIEVSWKEFVAPKTPGLLGALQQSILHNKDLEKGNDKDGSIVVNACHTPIREAEVLYDYLLDLFEKDKGQGKLSPGDILVMTPDIGKYEPFVKAVFRNAPVKLPFKVSGAPANLGDTLCTALELLMDLREEDLTAEKVMGLLEQNRIRKRFGVKDTSYLRAAVNKAGIRFGLENRLEDDTRYVGWKHGLERFILGYAMDTDKEFGDKYPYRDAEASASHDLLRLKAFVDDLEGLFKMQSTSLTFGKWKEWFLERMVEGMVYSNDFDKQDREEKTAIYRALGFTEDLHDETAVPYEVFLHELKQRLFAESHEHDLVSGRITFTQATSARGLPFKVIAFLGLDNGVFPRKDNFPGFDLLGEEYRPGDRSRKENDKFLFLETIMAVREKLYLSYPGQDVKDNEDLPPSIVLDNLLHYLHINAVNHPLHGFSKKYDDQGLFTYLHNSRPAAFNEKQTDPNDDDKSIEVRVDDFVRFFEAPIDWYFKNVLGIKYEEGDDTLPETELFKLDSLQKWQLKNELMTLQDTTESGLKTFTRKKIKQGQLPLKNIGRAVMESLFEEVKPVKEKLLEVIKDQSPECKHIDITLDKLRITGEIDGVYGKTHVSWAFSKKSKYAKRAFLRGLLLSQQGFISSVGHIDGDGKLESILTLDGTKAKSHLEKLIGWFRKGQAAPLKFTLKVAEKTAGGNPEDQKLQQKAKSEFHQEAYPTYRNANPNKYLQVLFGEGFFDNLNQQDMENIIELTELLNTNTSNND